MSSILPSPRRSYIDWARGIAVLIMLQAHTLDAWTRRADRRTGAYFDLTMLGGFAAPLFLWLAGLALVLAAERQLAKGASRRAATASIVRRGAEIFILAFLFRLQAFIVSPGSWTVTIFRVDILNVMGPAIAATGLLWGISGTRIRAVLACAVSGVALAMVTPLVRTAEWVNALPLWIQWHLRPFGDHTTFTLLPWAGFVFAGAACGTLVAVAIARSREGALYTAIATVGAVLIALGLYTSTLPSIYQSSSFWTSSPTYFAIRVGAMMLFLAACYAAVPLMAHVPRVAGVLERFGSNSMFIYWIHVELVYGYATWPLRQKLPLWGFPLAFAVFATLMYLAVGLRDRIVSAWRRSRRHPSRATAVPA